MSDEIDLSEFDVELTDEDGDKADDGSGTLEPGEIEIEEDDDDGDA